MHGLLLLGLLLIRLVLIAGDERRESVVLQAAPNVKTAAGASTAAPTDRASNRLAASRCAQGT